MLIKTPNIVCIKVLTHVEITSPKSVYCYVHTTVKPTMPLPALAYKLNHCDLFMTLLCIYYVSYLIANVLSADKCYIYTNVKTFSLKC